MSSLTLEDYRSFIGKECHYRDPMELGWRWLFGGELVGLQPDLLNPDDGALLVKTPEGETIAIDLDIADTYILFIANEPSENMESATDA